uniref:LAGLIDADG homing endonuclease n=1 Tax=Rhizoctonia solani TaxID=456999 RepID=A0A8E8L7Q3_9AGAM|nr:LAGLIDADG homing endonuclease [Rhizoctonia solani]
MKKNYLTKEQRLQFVLPENLKFILIGLLLGDLYGQIQKTSVNVRFRFEQSTIHKDYLFHLYNLFQSFCTQAPKVNTRLPDKRTGEIYSNIYFNTYSLPCFKELYSLFYLEGKKVIPSNIADLLTPMGLAYWIADDGCWNKDCKYVVLCTDSFLLTEVELLISALNDKFDLKCYKCKHGNSYRIIIPSYSIPNLQSLLISHMPPMMMSKIGL